jgi:hypothetical protein
LDVAEAYQRLFKAGRSNVWIAEQYRGNSNREDEVRRMLKIANLPIVAKASIRGEVSDRVLRYVRMGKESYCPSYSDNCPNYFKEGYFREITQLRSIDQIKIVVEIALSKGQLKDDKIGGMFRQNTISRNKFFQPCRNKIFRCRNFLNGLIIK